VENFLLYDFYTQAGSVDENVLAYSNQLGSDHALVVLNNRFDSTQGWIRTSAQFVSRSGGSERRLVQLSLGEGLGVRAEEELFLVARDQASGLEHIFPTREIVENGLFLELSGYQYHVFIDFRTVRDDEWRSYHHLAAYLNGRGVPNIQEALRELTLQPVLGPFREIANAGYWAYLDDQRLELPKTRLVPSVLAEAETKLSHLLDGIQQLTGQSASRPEILARLQAGLEAALSLSVLGERYPLPASKVYSSVLAALADGLDKDKGPRWAALLGWIFIRDLGRITDSKSPLSITRSWIDEWQLGKTIEEAARGLGLDPIASARTRTLVSLLTDLQDWYHSLGSQPLSQFFSTLLANEEVRLFLNINRYKDVLWFNQEAFDELQWWLCLLALLDALSDPNGGAALLAERALICADITQRLQKAAKVSSFQVAKLLAALE
jgi:hypothetical protein